MLKGQHVVSNYYQFNCLIDSLSFLEEGGISDLLVTGPLLGESTMDFSYQRTSNVVSDSVLKRYYYSTFVAKLYGDIYLGQHRRNQWRFKLWWGSVQSFRYRVQNTTMPNAMKPPYCTQFKMTGLWKWPKRLYIWNICIFVGFGV